MYCYCGSVCVCLHMYDMVGVCVSAGAYVPGAHVVRAKKILAKRIEGRERRLSG